MKAIIEMDKRNIEVMGKDLTVDSNMLTGEIYVVDRADNRRVFCGHKSLINCVHIIDNMECYAAQIEPQEDMVVCTYKETGCGSCEYQTNCLY